MFSKNILVAIMSIFLLATGISGQQAPAEPPQIEKLCLYQDQNCFGANPVCNDINVGVCKATLVGIGKISYFSFLIFKLNFETIVVMDGKILLYIDIF